MNAEASTSAQAAAGPAGYDAGAAMAKQVVKKIDRVIMPLLFVTYMLNFMDKIILSSAAVFGLRDDTVSHLPPPSSLLLSANSNVVFSSTSKARNTAGLAASSTLGIWCGSCQPTFSSPSYRQANISLPTQPSGVLWSA